MSPPVGLLGAGLLFWGWHAQLLVLAVPMAVLAEAPRHVPWRWEFSDRDLNRLSDFTNLLFAGGAFYLFARHGPHGVYAVIRWMPVALFLLAAAQLYSTRGSVSLGSLFLSVRRYQASGMQATAPRIDLSYPYFATCVVAAGVAAHDTSWLYPGLLVLLAWSMKDIRPRRYPVRAWAGLLLLAAALGFMGQWGILNLQLTVEELVLAWFKDRPWSDTDPYRSRTAIGHIGRLKFSERIVLRVTRLDESTVPLLLRQASYQTYRGTAWHADQQAFRALPRGTEPGSWLLGEHTAGGSVIDVAGPIQRGRAVLAIPGGAFRIEGLPAPVLRGNDLGAVRLDDGPGFISYRARFTPASRRDRPPMPADGVVPKPQQASIERIARELALRNQDPGTVIERLGAFFEEFRYSLAPSSELDDLPPLAHFLLHSRRGHCEYFATATVLLLRAAGIPSRYATGYAVQEQAGGRDTYVVRARHAHAWALAYVHGQWVDVDFTPAEWAALEEQEASWWLPAYDLLSAAAFSFFRWWWSGNSDVTAPWILWTLVALLGLLVGWRLSRHKRAAVSAGHRPGRGSPAARRGQQSEFSRLLPHLETSIGPRRPGETLQAWLGRRSRDTHSAVLREALVLHYRCRFDPNGLSGRDRERLKALVDAWLAANARER